MGDPQVAGEIADLINKAALARRMALAIINHDDPLRQALFAIANEYDALAAGKAARPGA